MSGSGLKDTFSQVYADGSIDQMICGKAVARAVHAHFLLDSALSTIVTASMCKVPIPN